MAGIVYALVLLGCADGAADCEPLQAPAPIFSSLRACQAQQEQALLSDPAQRADYPTVAARCVARGPNGASADKNSRNAPSQARR